MGRLHDILAPRSIGVCDDAAGLPYGDLDLVFGQTQFLLAGSRRKTSQVSVRPSMGSYSEAASGQGHALLLPAGETKRWIPLQHVRGLASNP